MTPPEQYTASQLAALSDRALAAYATRLCDLGESLLTDWLTAGRAEDMPAEEVFTLACNGDAIAASRLRLLAASHALRSEVTRWHGPHASLRATTH